MPPVMQLSRDDLAQVVAGCPRLTLDSFVQFCFGQKASLMPAAPWAQMDTPVTMREIVSLLCALGAFEPLSSTRPGACDVRMVFDDTVEVPPATLDDQGNVVPSTVQLIVVCAPMHRSLVVDVLRGTAANLTASQRGSVFFKMNQIFGFSDGWCPPGEAKNEDLNGVFNNVEHIVLCPGSGYTLNARNTDPFSPALFDIHAEYWSTC